MEIYVAGKTDDWERVRRIQEACTRLGHSITYDWTRTVEKVGPDACTNGTVDEDFRRTCAEEDRRGVEEADLLIACVDFSGLCGTLIEIGMALAGMKPNTAAQPKRVIIIGEPERNSVFFALREVTQVKDEFELLDHLPVVV